MLLYTVFLCNFQQLLSDKYVIMENVHLDIAD